MNELSKIDILNALAGFMSKVTMTGADVQLFNACMQYLQTEFEAESAKTKTEVGYDPQMVKPLPKKE